MKPGGWGIFQVPIDYNNPETYEDAQITTEKDREIHFWQNLTRTQKLEKFSIFLTDFREIDHLLEYFELFSEDLSKKTLNSYLKSVSNP